MFGEDHNKMLFVSYLNIFLVRFGVADFQSINIAAYELKDVGVRAGIESLVEELQVQACLSNSLRGILESVAAFGW